MSLLLPSSPANPPRLDNRLASEVFHPMDIEEKHLSGLAYLKGVLEGRLNPPPVTDLVGYRLVSVAEGHTHYELQPRKCHTNPFGTVHGGILTTLMDTAMTAAVWSTLGPGMIAATMGLNVNFIRPATLNSGPLRCDGRVIHVGRRTATAEGRLVDEEGQLCAHGTATCTLLNPVARPTANASAEPSAEPPPSFSQE